MRKRLIYKLGVLARLPFLVITRSVLNLYDGFLDLLMGPTNHGSRREIRRWSTTVKNTDRLEQANHSSTDQQSDKLRFGQGEVVNHLAEMNRRAGSLKSAQKIESYSE